MYQLATWALLGALISSNSVAEPLVQKRYSVNYSRPLPHDIVERVKSLDPEEKAHPVNPGKDDTPFGLRFDESCTKALSKEPETRRRQLAAMNGTVAEVFNRILVCRDNYPELEPWIRTWIAMARRHHISCVKESSQHENAAAWNNHGKHTVYTIDTFEKTSNGDGGAIFKDGLETITLVPWTIDTLIHEVFHATPANNRADHDVVEFISTKHKTNQKTGLDVVECNDDIAMDRVNIVASLCSGQQLVRGQQNALFELTDRMAQCPESKGCVGIFSHDVRDNIAELQDYISNKIYPRPSEKLSLDQSRLLCARIRDQADCQRNLAHFDHWRGDPPEKEKGRANFTAKVSKVAEIKALRKRLRDRLSKITPNFENELPGEWINLDPGAKSEFDALKNDSCFKAMFLLSPSGNYFVGGSPKKADAFNGLSRFSGVSTLAGHIQFGLMRRVVAASKAERSCQGSTTPDRVKNAVELIQERLDSDEVVDNSEGYYHIANNAFDEHVNRIGAGWAYAEIGPVLTQLIGKELVEYTDRVLGRLHPYSKTFDCVAAGYSTNTAAELARQGLHGTPTLSPQSCQ